MSRLEAVISDFGGVLTTPLMEAFAAMQGDHGVPLGGLGQAMARITREDGRNPLHELETGRMTEAAFLGRLARAVHDELGLDVRLHRWSEGYFRALKPNDEMIAFMAGLRDRGLRAAILTNNVREWEPLWRAMLPVDEIFELVVDSAFVGMRKPDPEIYTLTLERLGLPAERCLFVDDIDVNCDTAAALGLTAVHFRSNAQAIAELEMALAGRPAPA